MKQRAVIYALAGLAFAVLSACSGTETEPDLPPLSAEEISAARLWERITQETDYQQYAFWPGHEDERPGQSPHGVIHRITVNRTLLESLPRADSTAPAGSIVVKDNLDAAGELTAVSVMAKIDGFAPESGDWFWGQFAPDGTVLAAGAVASCIACHQGVASNDYVIVQKLNSIPSR